MCDPTIAAGMAMSGLGQAYNSRQMSKNQGRMVDARNAATAAEMARQEGYQEEGSGYFDESLANFEKSKQDIGLANQGRVRGDKIEQSLSAANEYAPTTGSAPSVVNTEIARKINDAMKSGKKTARSLGNMGAFGDQQFNNKLALNNSNQNLSNLSNNANRSMGLLPLEQQVASSNASKSPNMIGDLLSMAGQGAAMYGMTGGDIFSGDMFSGFGGSGLEGLGKSSGGVMYNPMKPSSYTKIVT